MRNSLKEEIQVIRCNKFYHNVTLLALLFTVNPHYKND